MLIYRGRTHRESKLHDMNVVVAFISLKVGENFVNPLLRYVLTIKIFPLRDMFPPHPHTYTHRWNMYIEVYKFGNLNNIRRSGHFCVRLYPRADYIFVFLRHLASRNPCSRGRNFPARSNFRNVRTDCRAVSMGRHDSRILTRRRPFRIFFRAQFDG